MRPPVQPLAADFHFSKLRSLDAHDSENHSALDRQCRIGVSTLRGIPGADGEAQSTQRPLAPRGNSWRKPAGERGAVAGAITREELAASRRTIRKARTLERCRGL